jgi:hypothetical protein
VVVGSGQNVTGANFGLFKTLLTGTANADAYSIDIKPADANNVLRIWENVATNQTPTYQIPRTLLSLGLTIDTQDGDDVFTVDFTNGTPLPPLGLTLIAGAGTNDQLVMIGASSAETFSVNANFTVGYSGGVGPGNLVYSGVESLTVNAAGGNDTINDANPAGVAVSLNGQTGSDTLNLTNGASYTFNADAQASSASLTLNIAAGSNVTFNATQHLEGLNVSGTATTSAGGALVLVTKGLTIPAGGQLDLKDNDLVVDWTGTSVIGSWNGSAYTGVTGMIAAGRNGGPAGGNPWNGSGIISSLAQGSDYTTLGIRAPVAASVFSGQSVDASSVLVKFTYGGDASFDGKLNIDDYTKIDSGIAAGTRGWLNGDFNYDGKVNIDDYVIIDNNVGTQGPAL